MNCYRKHPQLKKKKQDKQGQDLKYCKCSELDVHNYATMIWIYYFEHIT